MSSAGDLDDDLLPGKLLLAALSAFIRPALQVTLLITITSQPSESVHVIYVFQKAVGWLSEKGKLQGK